MSEYKIIKTKTLDAICQSIRNAENSEDIVKISKVPERIDGLTVGIERLNTKIDKKSDFNKKLFEGTLTKITEEDLEGVTKLAAYCIKAQEQLTEINIPDTVEEFAGDCIFDCYKLAKIKLPFIGTTKENPVSLTTLVNEWAQEGLEIELTAATKLTNTFKQCSIKKVILNNGITSIPVDCFSSSTITEVVLPDTLTEIDDYAFDDCSNLKEINLPEGIKILGDYSFSGTGLDHIKLSGHFGI